jgi:hypothetical protein
MKKKSMKKFFRLLNMGALCSAFCLGLQAEPKKSLAERSPFGNKPKSVAPPPKTAVAPRPAPKTLEFRGVVVSGGKVYCVLFDKAKNRGASVPLRDSSAEYFVERYDDRSQTISVRTPNGSQILELQNSPSAPSRGGYDYDSGGYGRGYEEHESSSPFDPFPSYNPEFGSAPVFVGEDESDESDWSFDED